VVTAGHGLLEQGKRLHLVGLSMGGAICLLAAPLLGAASLTTINAAINVRSRRMWIAPLFRGSDRVLEEDARIPPDDEARPYFQQYDGNPIGSTADLQDLIRAARRNLAVVTCPALVIQSLRDETVRPESGRIIYSGISSTDKTLLWLQKSRHNALVDVERGRIHRAVKGRISSAR
jgi:carboxylesterase